jgi:hypothetical protein
MIEMGIEWVVFGAAWCVMAGYALGNVVEFNGEDMSNWDAFVSATWCVILAPFVFGLALRSSK